VGVAVDCKYLVLGVVRSRLVLVVEPRFDDILTALQSVVLWAVLVEDAVAE
jgi:hypothetical protein